MTKSKRVAPEVQDLAEQVGEFIQYWGFKRIHGKIWCHLFLSSEPLDAGVLIQRLKVSKALISISIRDLMEYSVIEEAGKSDAGTILYRANPRLTEVICNVLRGRERRLISRVRAAHQLLAQMPQSEKTDQNLDTDKISEIGEMIEGADHFLDSLLALDRFAIQDLDIVPKSK